MYNSNFQIFEFSFLDFYTSLGIIAMTCIFFAAMSAKYLNNYYEGLLIYTWHSFWGIIFLILSQYHGFSDSSGWYTDTQAALQDGRLPLNVFDLTHYTQNYFLYLLNLVLQKIGLKYLSINLIFNFFSSIGLFFLYISINKKFFLKYIALFILLFFPSFMFWTSGVSKDSIILFPIGLIIYYCLKFEKKLFKILIATIIIFLIRPYFGFLIIISLFSYYFFEIIKNYKQNRTKIFFLILFLFLSFLSANFILGKLNISDVYSLMKTIQSQYREAFLAIPQDQNFFIRIFSYYLRPAIFDFYPNIIIIFITFENLILLLIILFLVINLNYKNFFSKKKENIFLMVLIFLAMIFFSQFTNNYGTALRQKWMSLPFIIFFLISNQKVFYFLKRRIL